VKHYTSGILHFSGARRRGVPVVVLNLGGARTVDVTVILEFRPKRLRDDCYALRYEIINAR
jgi:hypothetical protein